VTDLLDEIEDRLLTDNVGGGATGFDILKTFLPPDPDQVIVLFESAGDPPGTTIAADRPGFQVRVRGKELEYEVARAKLKEAFDSLHLFTGNLLGVYYVSIMATGSAFPLGYDKSDRPEVAQNYIAMRSRA